MDYGLTVKLDVPYDEAVPRVKEAFKAQGFGTLTEIDMRATLREKIGAEVEPFVILGVCNPNFAYGALEVSRDIGLLLPCNVVVRESDGGVVVQALDPEMIATVAALPKLEPIAEEAAERIRAALDALAAGSRKRRPRAQR